MRLQIWGFTLRIGYKVWEIAKAKGGAGALLAPLALGCGAMPKAPRFYGIFGMCP
jgi:hypothetical protein